MRRFSHYAISGLAGLIAQVATAHHGWVAYYDRDQPVTVPDNINRLSIID